MNLRYLLDTNALSEPLRKDPSPCVLDKIHRHQTEIATAAPVLYEIIRGAHRLLSDSEKRARILEYAEEFIRATLPVLPCTEETALWHGMEVARLMTLGVCRTCWRNRLIYIGFKRNGVPAKFLIKQ